MRAVERAALIIRALRRDDRSEEEASAFLAEHDAGVRADALAEGAALLRRQAGRKIGRPVHNSGLRTGAILLERAADRPATTVGTEDTDPTFFQVGHTYAREHHASTIRFLVKFIDESPDGFYRVAFGWRTEDGDVCASPFDSDDMGGWSDITEVTP